MCAAAVASSTATNGHPMLIGPPPARAETAPDRTGPARADPVHHRRTVRPSVGRYKLGGAPTPNEGVCVSESRGNRTVEWIISTIHDTDAVLLP